jgi:F0F1-type ATP synthase assembly protein I
MRSDGPSGAELAGLGAFLAAAVVVPLLAGAALDGALHTAPRFLLGGLVLGVAAAAAAVYTRFKRYL